MDKISVIIPVYNVELYIRKCLDSVISQTYAELEILLINDGSTDNSGKICDEYAARDNRIRVFYKSNDGVSSAKNFGLKYVTGKYIGFVDADDWLEPDMYELLYKSLKEKKVPISVGNYFKDTDSESIPMLNKYQIPDDEISAKNMIVYALKRDYYLGFCAYLWNKLFSAEIILNNVLKFDEDINYGEDVLFYANTVLSEKCKGVFTDKPLYHYYQRNTSIAKSKSVRVKKDILKAYKKIEELLNSNGYCDISFWARGFYCYHAGVVAEIAAGTNDKETLFSMQNEIKNHLDDYIKTNKKFPEKIERMRRLLELPN